MKRLLMSVLVISTAACATPKEVKELAKATGPFVAETQKSSEEVQKRFIAQDAAVANRIAQMSYFEAKAKANHAMTETLWRVDAASGGPKAAGAKANLLLLGEVRDYVPVRLREGGTGVSAIARPKTIQTTNPKLLKLLSSIGNGEFATLSYTVDWLRETDEQLAELNKEAAADQEDQDPPPDQKQ